MARALLRRARGGHMRDIEESGGHKLPVTAEVGGEGGSYADATQQAETFTGAAGNPRVDPKRIVRPSSRRRGVRRRTGARHGRARETRYRATRQGLNAHDSSRGPGGDGGVPRGDRVALRVAAAERRRGHRRPRLHRRSVSHRRAVRFRTASACSVRTSSRNPAAPDRADPARRDAPTQFYIAYSFYREGWGRVYSDDRAVQAGARDVEPGDRPCARPAAGRRGHGLVMHTARSSRPSWSVDCGRKLPTSTRRASSHPANDSAPRSVVLPVLFLTVALLGGFRAGGQRAARPSVSHGAGPGGAADRPAVRAGGISRHDAPERPADPGWRTFLGRSCWRHCSARQRRP